jgi:hypothetical protein
MLLQSYEVVLQLRAAFAVAADEDQRGNLVVLAVQLFQKGVDAAVDKPHLLRCRFQFIQELGFLFREVGHSLMEADQHFDHSH